jgi:hypothetical protein
MNWNKCLSSLFFTAILLHLPSSTGAQAGAGTITGTATDTDHDVLPGAPVKLDPGNTSVTTNQQGEFTITNVAAGTYTVTVSYLGFTDSTAKVTVTAGQVTKVDAVLQVATQDWKVAPESPIQLLESVAAAFENLFPKSHSCIRGTRYTTSSSVGTSFLGKVAGRHGTPTGQPGSTCICVVKTANVYPVASIRPSLQRLFRVTASPPPSM